MITVKVTKPFIRSGEEFMPGRMLTVPSHALNVLADHVKVLGRTEIVLQKQKGFTRSDQPIVDEAEHRADFCSMHRELIDGNCTRYNVMCGIEPGDRVTALDGCLLWRLVKVGTMIELAGAAEVLSGVTVADVLQRIRHLGDQDRVRKERRLLLICAEL